MYRREGFTVVELIITISIMVILVTLSTVQLLDTIAEGRDEERRTDVMNIIMFQEGAYNRGAGVYFPENSATTNALIESSYGDLDRNNLRAPGVTAGSYSLVEATNTTETPTGVTPRPTATTYVYQALTSTGGECKTPATSACRKFNIYFLQETDDTVQMLSSKNQ